VPAVLSLHQVPRAPGDFTGREAELAELEAALAEGAVAISGVRGMGGVGKTALALKVAERLKGRYPDAQLFVEMKGSRPPALRPAEAMGQVIWAYRPEVKLPESEGELGGVYRSVLRGKRALLLLDDAAGAGQVEPLLPPAGCAVLVTSRRHFTLPGMTTVNLDTMKPEGAEALLLKIAPRIGERAEEMARLCGYLPLALRVAGSALAERADLRAEDYLRRLRDSRTRRGLVEASVSLSYELLSEELQRLWRILAIFPGTFDVGGAAAVWAMEGEAAHDALSELVRYSLVEWRQATARYGLHELVRLCADEWLEDGERAGGERRHAAHYERVLGAADELYLRGGEGVLRGLAVLDVEWENVQVGQAWAAVHVGEDRTAAQLCSAYPDVGAYCLDLRQSRQERIRWLEVAADAAQRLGDRRGEGNALGNLGNAYSDLGQVQETIRCYERALAIGQEIGDRRGEGNALGNLGNAYSALGQVQEAIRYYQRALAIAQEIGDRRGEGNRLGNLGIAYYVLGQVEMAIGCYGRAVAIAQEVGDRRGEGRHLGNLGIAYGELGQVQETIGYYERALALAQEIGDRRGEGIWSWNLGLLYEETDPAWAVELMSVRVVYEREIGHPDAEGDGERVERIRRRVTG